VDDTMPPVFDFVWFSLSSSLCWNGIADTFIYIGSFCPNAKKFGGKGTNYFLKNVIFHPPNAFYVLLT